MKTPNETTPADKDEPRFLACYGEGALIPPMQTDADRAAFEARDRDLWEHRSD